ncbi:peptidoglycan-binding domain-containing protein [Clostridium sardiniense]|uniref:peptidoglycan-binding domain-containing protein n=1 Tax=Clostridium sardiniense TaxID=29369 RepID=UPI001958CCB5|nr:peptidoglycan-binding domain-containing protein [Clostridium sardiniense]MBM7836298.1 peptidoglycan hydrolase-like protein with peptidoglycan-binding domain [Clostridium sardiniense]
MKNLKIKLSILTLTGIIGTSCIAPSLTVMANEKATTPQKQVESVKANEQNYSLNQLKQKSIDVESKIKSQILARGYSSVDEYNNQIGTTIPVEQSIYYNNFEYYNTPLPETIENNDERAIALWIWAKAAWANPWVRKAVVNFGKAVIAGAGAAVGSTIVNDTREVMKNGFPKISTHSSGDVVGYGRVTRGNKVKVAQTLLRQHGYNIAVDGIWGPASESATKKFQRKLNMSADGLIGKHTWAYLIEKLK